MTEYDPDHDLSLLRGHRVRCEQCRGRGWLSMLDAAPCDAVAASRFPEPCDVCNGWGSLSEYRLARLMGGTGPAEVSARARLRALRRGAIKPRAALRLLRDLSRVLRFSRVSGWT